MGRMQANTDRDLGLTSAEIINECMVISAVESTALALESGLREHQIIISAKVSRPGDLVAVYRALARQTTQPLHLGLTGVTACPGRGRTTSSTFQELSERIQGYVGGMIQQSKSTYDGVEDTTVAVMGCVVNGPGESKAANIGISLPGTGEEPTCPVYVDGRHATILRGSYDEVSEPFRRLIDDYVEAKYARKPTAARQWHRPARASGRCHVQALRSSSTGRRAAGTSTRRSAEASRSQVWCCERNRASMRTIGEDREAVDLATRFRGLKPATSSV